MVVYSVSSRWQAVRLALLRQFFQADMAAKAVIPEGRFPKPLTAWIVPFHVVDQIADFTPQRRSRSRMSRRLSAEREMRLVRPLELGFFQEATEQHAVFLV